MQQENVIPVLNDPLGRFSSCPAGPPLEPMDSHACFQSGVTGTVRSSSCVPHRRCGRWRHPQDAQRVFPHLWMLLEGMSHDSRGSFFPKVIPNQR